MSAIDGEAAHQTRSQNRYAHLVSNASGQTDEARLKTQSIAAISEILSQKVQTFTAHNEHDNSNSSSNNNNNNNNNNNLKQQYLGGLSQPPNASNHAPSLRNQCQSRTSPNNSNNNNYYASFSNVDWREQWIMFKERTMEKVGEPDCQRKLIMLIVCTALLLDNMLYMVIVPIIPDYLRSIGSWSTYTENAKWVRKNSSHGRTQWEQVGGQTVYEGEDSAVGFLFASKALVQLIANPFSGAIADRIGYEIPMMFGLIVMFLSTMVFACGQTYSVLFLARSLQGVGSAFADTPGIALLADRFTEETERRRAQGIAIAFISFGCLVAPPFGSVLYQGAGKEVPFILLSLVCLIDGSLLLLVTPPGTFSQIWPRYSGQTTAAAPAAKKAPSTKPVALESPLPNNNDFISQEQQQSTQTQANSDDSEANIKKRALYRQKSISRRHSITMSAGEAPKGTPIEVLLRDPCIACCAGALVVANISLAFLEPTISIWVKSTMPDTEEWQEGLIWLPAFFPHVLGVFATLHFAEKYPQSTWKIAASGLVIEGLGCLVVPFCSSFWSLIIPISVICFGVALIDTAILPTLGYLVDTRFTSVYGNVYAIADISYSISYAIGPIIAGAIVEAIGFTALNFLIAVVTLGYTPSLMMLRSIRAYQPFEADASGRAQERERPFGQFGRKPIETDEDQEEEDDLVDANQQQAPAAIEYQAQRLPATKYASPGWADSKGSSLKKSSASGPKSVKIAEITTTFDETGAAEQQSKNSNPFLAQHEH